MINKRYMLMIVGSILLVIVAFFFLSRALSWNYVSDLVKERTEPTTDIDLPEEVIQDEFVSLTVSLDDPQFEAFMKLVEKMKSIYPHIIVEVKQSDLNYAAWENSMQLGELGDVGLIANEWILPLSVQGLLQPVDRLMNSEVLTAQVTGYIDALKWNGYTWGIPYYSNPYVIFRHRSIVEQEQSTIADEEAQADNEAASDPTNHWSLLIQMAEQVKSENPGQKLLNIDTENYAAMLVWLNYWNENEQEGINLNELSPNEADQLQWLLAHEQFIEQTNIEEESQFPLWYMTTWDEYSQQRKTIAPHYDIQSLDVPIPWLNGKSFVLKASYNNAGGIVEWIEKITQLASADANNVEAAPTRAIESLVSNRSDSISLYQALGEKLAPSQIMKVSPTWAITFEQRQLAWNEQINMEQKLQLLQMQ